MRLDQIIINRRLATEEQVCEALDYQKEYGGRLETHLFRMGYVDEPGLVEALAEQFACPKVVLKGLDVPPEVLQMLPAETAWTRLALPFAFDSSTQTLKIACESSRRTGLQEDLEAACPGSKIELHIALGVVLQMALVKYYREVPRIVENAPTDIPSAMDAVSVPIEWMVSYSAKCEILVYEEEGSGAPAMGPLLRHQGFIVGIVHTADELATAVRKSEPDAILFIMPDGPESVDNLLAQLSDRAISILEFPSYLVIASVEDSEIGGLLQLGFEEVIRVQNVLDLLMIKLKRLKERLVSQRNQRQEILQAMGTHGSLQDMHVVDLLQAMGTIGKTARISVTAVGKQLTIYLDRGRIIYADCDDVAGPEAVYGAIGWNQGVWNVDPIQPEELPAPNIFISSEGILLEGCRRMDEKTRPDGVKSQDDSGALLLFEALDRASNHAPDALPE